MRGDSVAAAVAKATPIGSTAPPSPSALRAPSVWREAAAGLVAGAATDAAFYSVDGYKAQLQSGMGRHVVDIGRMCRGLVSLSLVVNAPSLAFFFASYEAVKQAGAPGFGDSAAGVLAASALCAVPASLISVPGDTLKKRVVLGIDATPAAALRAIVRSNLSGAGGLMVGWKANLAKDVPFAALKMSLYEGLLRLAAYLSSPPVERECFNSRMSTPDVGAAGKLPASVLADGMRQPSGIVTAGRDKEGGSSIEPKPGNQKIKQSRAVGGDLQQIERAAVGFCSGAITAVLTNPLDVVNTRIKGGSISGSEVGILKGGRLVLRSEGPAALFAGLAPRVFIIGLGSSMFFFLLEHAKTGYDFLVE
jgi:hypothetical protein